MTKYSKVLFYRKDAEFWQKCLFGDDIKILFTRPFSWSLIICNLVLPTWKSHKYLSETMCTFILDHFYLLHTCNTVVFDSDTTVRKNIEHILFCLLWRMRMINWMLSFPVYSIAKGGVITIQLMGENLLVGIFVAKPIFFSFVGQKIWRAEDFVRRIILPNTSVSVSRCIQKSIKFA